MMELVHLNCLSINEDPEKAMEQKHSYPTSVTEVHEMSSSSSIGQLAARTSRVSSPTTARPQRSRTRSRGSCRSIVMTPSSRVNEDILASTISSSKGHSLASRERMASVTNFCVPRKSKEANNGSYKIYTTNYVISIFSTI